MEEEQNPISGPRQRHLPHTRSSVTHKFCVGGFEGYLTVGLYEDGTPGELFITSQKQGMMERGLLHCLAVIVSVALQNGVSLGEITDKLKLVKFDPAGVTGNPDIPMADSVADYVGKWLEMRFLDCSELSERRNRETDSL